ncbi:MAG TPA: bifunctional 5,10-methylenetetrahydrofolate dehydrogenase/5,10-methenyltetrahydrofolate cyclohydrolase [Haploplasma sp.]|nr:bifunctional 5,10-methylenetetrahydrofolate dehydrogenase/5,10-methenyltetrahydrofolate cyclohydrolase [Haploplasma sp.]
MTLLDGFKVAKIRNEQLKLQIEEDTKKGLTVPKAAIILVGDDPASKIYVNSKLRDSKKVGILSELVELPTDVSEEVLEEKISELNNDNSVTGILLQLPLPKHLDDKKFINLIDTKKDIDGFTLANQGLLFQGLDATHAATPQGIINLLDHYNINVSGMNVVVIGRSQIVGLPIGKLLLDRNATVTTCHSRTKDLSLYTKTADLIIMAVGIPKLLKADMVKEGVVVIDVGINRVDGKLVGDVDFDEVSKLASYITPVPRGVGPMTINALLENIYKISK